MTTDPTLTKAWTAHRHPRDSGLQQPPFQKPTCERQNCLETLTDNFESHQIRQREVPGKEHVCTVCVYLSTVNTCGGWYRHTALHKSTYTWVQAHAAAPGPCSSPEHAHKANGCLASKCSDLLTPSFCPGCRNCKSCFFFFLIKMEVIHML